MSELRICALPGDGVGPEVTEAALRVLEAVAARFGHATRVERAPVGWAAVRSAGSPLPDATLARCRDADAVLLGAVGHPDARRETPERRPETGLLRLRECLGCRINLRPVRVDGARTAFSPLRPEIAAGTDVLLVRELSGGIYYGTPRWDEPPARAPGPPGGCCQGSPTEGLRPGRRGAGNTMSYTGAEVSAAARAAFRLARRRRGRVASVDKANVLEVSRLWRRHVDAVAAEHPDVRLRHVLVDRAAMEVVREPARFDVLLSPNLFGDLLSDELAGVAGSIGLLGSASLPADGLEEGRGSGPEDGGGSGAGDGGGSGRGIFEPVHGSAPEIAGRDVANPVGAVVSVALLLRHALGLTAEADAVEAAVDAVLEAGFRTPELAGDGPAVGTAAMADRIAARVARGRGAPPEGCEIGRSKCERRVEPTGR